MITLQCADQRRPPDHDRAGSGDPRSGAALAPFTIG
jgi:hypothetical protein